MKHREYGVKGQAAAIGEKQLPGAPIQRERAGHARGLVLPVPGLQME